jgi:ComF family protein
VAPLRYEGYPQAWVGRLKDHLGMVEGRILGTLLADAAEDLYHNHNDLELARPQVLIPVPLTARRLARRGHNQALTLARPVAQRLGVPVLRRAAIRLRPGRRQRGLSRSERLDNPLGNFASRRSWHDTAPCIAIVDDVMTTGATATELARILLAAGAGEVHVLSATRTARKHGSGGTVCASPTRQLFRQGHDP